MLYIHASKTKKESKGPQFLPLETMHQVKIWFNYKLQASLWGWIKSKVQILGSCYGQKH